MQYAIMIIRYVRALIEIVVIFFKSNLVVRNSSDK